MTIVKVVIIFTMSIWKNDRRNKEVTATKKTSSQQQEDIISREYLYSTERMSDFGARALREEHSHTKEQQAPHRISNDAILSDEMNDETALNGALRLKDLAS